MESKNRVAAVILGCATYFGSVWAVGAWMHGQGEKTAPRELQEQVQQLQTEVGVLERKNAELEGRVRSLLEDPAAPSSGTSSDTADPCQELQAEVHKLRAQVALKKLPEEVAAQVRLLTERGTWKPEADGTNLLKIESFYGPTPQPHSLAALEAIGALNDTSQGHYALYTVMATDFDKERLRRPKVFPLPYNRGWPETDELRTKEFVKDAAARKEREWLVQVQQALRDYGDELVAAGLLME